MRRPLAIAPTLIALLVTAGCATMGIGSYVAQPLEPGEYLTYEWGPADALPTGDPRLDNNTIYADYLTGAIDLGLAAKGLSRAAAGATPDLLIHYHATVTRKLLVDANDGVLNAYPVYRNEPRVQEYEAGTLVLDFLDGRTKRLLWRGWAEDTLENMLYDQPRMERHVAASVNRLMAELPFGRQ